MANGLHEWKHAGNVFVGVPRIDGLTQDRWYVLGVRVNCKDIANRFDMPFLNISVGINCGPMCVFFVGFLQAENEASIGWFIDNFKREVVLTPKLNAMDGSYFKIAAKRGHFTTSIIILDNWRLNIDRKKRIDAFVQSSRGSFTDSDMKNNLLELQNISKVDKFE